MWPPMLKTPPDRLEIPSLRASIRVEDEARRDVVEIDRIGVAPILGILRLEQDELQRDVRLPWRGPLLHVSNSP